MLSRFQSSVKARLPFLVPPMRAGVALARQAGVKRHVDRLSRSSREILLDVGAGDRKGRDGWITIDKTLTCDVFWDLRRGLPFPDARVSRIYSSHFLEHLSFREGQEFLKECKRVLLPGGTLSVCVPNAALYIRAYLSQSNGLDGGQFFGYKPAYNNTTRIDFVNYTAYMNGHHKYMFDEENLLHILAARGFKNVRLRRFDPSLDRPERDFESIYADAER